MYKQLLREKQPFRRMISRFYSSALSLTSCARDSSPAPSNSRPKQITALRKCHFPANTIISIPEAKLLTSASQVQYGGRPYPPRTPWCLAAACMKDNFLITTPKLPRHWHRQANLQCRYSTKPKSRIFASGRKACWVFRLCRERMETSWQGWRLAFCV